MTRNMSIDQVHSKEFFVSSEEFCEFDKDNDRKDNNRTGTHGPPGPPSPADPEGIRSNRS
jgi:hypothetical protein